MSTRSFVAFVSTVLLVAFVMICALVFAGCAKPVTSSALSPVAAALPPAVVASCPSGYGPISAHAARAGVKAGHGFVTVSYTDKGKPMQLFCTPSTDIEDPRRNRPVSNSIPDSESTKAAAPVLEAASAEAVAAPGQELAAQVAPAPADPSTDATTEYTGPITVSASETILAIAVAPGMSQSAVAKLAIKIAAAPPVFTPDPGEYATVQVQLSTETPGAAIYYALYGNPPSAKTTLYTGPFTVANSETIEAIAIAPGMEPSQIVTARYTLSPQTATPLITLVGVTVSMTPLPKGTYVGSKQVSMADLTPYAAIFYTTDGSEPVSK